MAIPVIIPLALSAISTGASIIQGIEARKDIRAANRSADDALAAAKRKLSIDRFAALQVPIEAYQMAEDAQVRQQQQALTALTEAGPRALAAGIGKVDLTGLQATEERRQKMAQDMFELDKLKAAEAAKRDVALSSLDLGVVQGAQNAALAAEQQASAAFTGAAQTLAGAGMDVYKASNLYGTDFAGRQAKSALDSGLITQDQVSDYTNFVNAIPNQDFRNLSQEQVMGGFKEYLTKIGSPLDGGTLPAIQAPAGSVFSAMNSLDYTPSLTNLSPNAVSGLTYTPTATLVNAPNIVPDQFDAFAFETLPQ